MKEVQQTILTAPGGDCFPACLASILEIELDVVPNYQEADWLQRYIEWIKPYGFSLLMTGVPDAASLADTRSLVMPGYTLLGVDSPRFPGHLHAVVAYEGEVIWDPHPAASPEDYPSLTWRDVTYFVVTDPSKVTFCYTEKEEEQ